MFKFYSSPNSKFFSLTPPLRFFRQSEEESATDPIFIFDVAPRLVVEVTLSTALLPVDQSACRLVELSCHQLFIKSSGVSYRCSSIVYASAGW